MPYPQTLVNVRVRDKAAVSEDEQVRAAIQAVEEQLGDTGRILVRPSGTEPLIRVMVEAPSKQVCEESVGRVVDVIRARGYELTEA